MNVFLGPVPDSFCLELPIVHQKFFRLMTCKIFRRTLKTWRWPMKLPLTLSLSYNHTNRQKAVWKKSSKKRCTRHSGIYWGSNWHRNLRATTTLCSSYWTLKRWVYLIYSNGGFELESIFYFSAFNRFSWKTIKRHWITSTRYWMKLWSGSKQKREFWTSSSMLILLFT